MAVWTDKFIQPNKYSRPQNRLTAIRKVVMHWTANFGATAEGHYRYFNNLSGRYASAHFFVDKLEALCIIPLNEISYHANDGSYKGVAELKPNANFLSVGIELCVEKDGSFHPSTISRAEDVAVELCKRYGLDPMTDIVRHYDITHKSCPTPWVSNSAPFVTFKKAVASKMGNPSVIVADNTPLLGFGYSGSAVVELQELLNKKGFKLSADGAFGEGTQKAVIQFQKDSKLEADGWVGDATWKALREVVKPIPVVKPVEKPVVKPVSNPKSHTVAKSETFYSIAEKYDMTVADLQKFNPRVNPSKLQVGDVIYLYAIPVKEAVKPVAKPVVKPVAKPVEKAIGNVVVETSSLNIRSGADLDSKVVGQAVKGAKFPVYEQKNGMFRIGVGKWISANEKYSKYTPVVVAKYHTVKSGDTVSQLADKYGSTIAQIKLWNKLDSKYTLQIGEKLRVK